MGQSPERTWGSMKKRTVKSILAAVCAAALSLALLLPRGAVAARGDDVVFIAIDEQVMELTAETMPVYRNWTYYVPYSVFDASVTGVDLGISIAAQPQRSRVTLFNKSGSLSFYPATQEIVDNATGNVMPYTTFYQNGRIYVPAVYTARFFGLDTYSGDTDYGYLIRIKSPACILSDEQFLDAAPNTLSSFLNYYLKSIAPSPSPTPTPAPPTPPAPSPGATAQPGDKSGVRTYLAFCHTAGGDTQAVLDLLDEAEIYGLVLFRPEALLDSADAVRRIAGSGHGIGLLVSGEALEAQLEEGNRLLAAIAMLRTHIVCVEGGGGEDLSQAGWVCWQGNVDGVPSDSANSIALAGAVLRAADARRSLARITLDDSAVSVRALPRILSGLLEAGYQLRLPVETEL